MNILQQKAKINTFVMNLESTLSNTVSPSQLFVLQLVNEFEDCWFTSEEVGHIITCTALHQSRKTWTLQPSSTAESADHNLCTSKTIHTDIIRNVHSIIIQ